MRELTDATRATIRAEHNAWLALCEALEQEDVSGEAFRVSLDELHAQALLINREPAPLREIVLERAEGPTAECGAVTVKSWHDAAWQLMRWSKTAPLAGGGYDKVDFRVIWADGESYSGRYDLQRDGESGGSARGFDLALHMRQFLAFLAHKPACPGYFRQHIEPHQDDAAASARGFIETRLPAPGPVAAVGWWCCEEGHRTR